MKAWSQKLGRQVYEAAKRVMDIVFAAVALLLMMPVLAVAALAIKLTSKGPILFGQIRVGRDGKPFRYVKFRTMYIDAESREAKLFRLWHEQTGPVFKISGDPRVTYIGRALRSTSIDELPTLWCVLRGDMSLVGPRPALPFEVDQYTQEQKARLTVKPGLTCYWQVSGRIVSWSSMIDMDLSYVRKRSLMEDIRVLALTIPVVFSRRGAH